MVITQFFDRLDRALRAVVISLVIFMLVILSFQVAMRYIANMPLSWSEELALLAFGWVVALITALGIRSVTHARMAILSDRLGAGVRRSLERLISLGLVVLGVYITIGGWDYYVMSFGMTSAAVGYPIAIQNAAAPVFGLLVTLFSLEKMIVPGSGEGEPI